MTVTLFVLALTLFLVGIYIDVSLYKDDVLWNSEEKLSRHFIIFLFVFVTMITCAMITCVMCLLHNRHGSDVKNGASDKHNASQTLLVVDLHTTGIAA